MNISVTIDDAEIKAFLQKAVDPLAFMTRARELAVFVGTRKALPMAVQNQDTSQRQTSLKELLMAGVQ